MRVAPPSEDGGQNPPGAAPSQLHRGPAPLRAHGSADKEQAREFWWARRRGKYPIGAEFLDERLVPGLSRLGAQKVRPQTQRLYAGVLLLLSAWLRMSPLPE